MPIPVSQRQSARLAVLVTAIGLALAARADTNFTQFGFTGPEFYPIDPGISQLHAADLDGDGLVDLIVVNNARAKINLLYNQTGHTNRTARPTSVGQQDLNELPADARFRIDSIASEKRIASLVVADLNSDGRPDLAYYGEPKELVVLYNQGTNGWSTPKRWPIDDGQLNANALVTGDLNGDHRTDLLLLGENNLYLLKQGPDHTLQEPQRIPYSGTVKSIQILDINGDGRDDLLLVNWDSPNPFRFRLQNDRGQLGPEIHFSLPPIRAYLADDLNGDHKPEVVTISLNSGRVNLANFTQRPADPLAGAFRQGQFQVLPLSKTGKARRGSVWADLTGKHHSDLLVAEPDSGQITLYLQQPDGTLGAAQTFPSLTGISDLAVGDWDGDGRPEIFMLSSDERQVGVTHLETNGRIPFPTLLPLDGTPLALAVGPLRPGSRPALALILDQDGKRLLQIRTADGKVKSQKLSDNFKSNPTSMSLVDADQDGLADLVVLIPYEKVKILRQVPNKDFEELDVAPPGGGSDQPWLSTADIDGDGKPELLLAEKNFVRAVVLQAQMPAAGATNKPDWMFKVKEQINGAASNSRIVGAAPLANGTNVVPALFLLDAELKALTLCDRDAAGVWRVVRTVNLPVSEFSSLVPVALGAERPNSLAFVGLNSVAWMALGGPVWELTELDHYETPIKDGYLHDVVSGDLNNDGIKDLVFLETAKNYLDIVAFQPPRRLVPADRWQVFEERTFRGRRSDVPEPREALVADLTGDHKNDLAVIVHDRILVYPQE